MTISISLKTPEGIVLGADSTMTVASSDGQVAQLFNSATAAIPDAGFLTATVNRCEGEVFGSRVELRNATVQPLAVGEMHIGGGFEVVSRLLFGYSGTSQSLFASIRRPWSKRGDVSTTALTPA